MTAAPRVANRGVAAVNYAYYSGRCSLSTGPFCDLLLLEVQRGLVDDLEIPTGLASLIYIIDTGLRAPFCPAREVSTCYATRNIGRDLSPRRRFRTAERVVVSSNRVNKSPSDRPLLLE